MIDPNCRQARQAAIVEMQELIDLRDGRGHEHADPFTNEHAERIVTLEALLRYQGRSA